MSLERDRYKANSGKYRSELLAAVDKLNRSELENNLLREKDKSRRNLEKYNGLEAHTDKTPRAKKDSDSRGSSNAVTIKDYDWSSVSDGGNDRNRSRKAFNSSRNKRTHDSIDLPRENSSKSLWNEFSLSDSEVFNTRASKPSNKPVSDSNILEGIEKDVFSIMKSLNGKHGRKSQIDSRTTSKSTERCPSDFKKTISTDSVGSSGSAVRQRFNKLNSMYRRLTGESCHEEENGSESDSF